MTITTLDPQTALIIVDLQRGIAASPKAHPLEPIVRNSAALADAFRRHGLPVVLVNVAGGAPGRTDQGSTAGREFPADFAELLPELNQQPGDHLVTKKTWGAFTNTGLGALLEDLGVTQVVLTGVATSIGVESTARSAHEAGLNVTVALDAMTDLTMNAHENSVTTIFPRLGETGTTQEILDVLKATRS
ncbi:cysteine hydrolase family protein [Arthrobacter sp. FW306-2-2C-D06B]|uniref:cysteine hydrolase family protein n=1 Tax=Arthrobacter sp. FW306-2-2C-D06B TaxID=2879618 RepID=UPI001F409B50|nr:isochorismatase family cysteine hydrolase [Arthrobacter sp. FW306-2-2C-D06B]UKA57004.1 cysteine hydrolase [Arthrobacter sp. FW306-2-2C-D06B]